MLTSDEVLNLNYYKKTSYTGWINGMRFLIRREAPEEGDAFFHAWVWPGPLIFSLTDDSLKTDFTARAYMSSVQQGEEFVETFKQQGKARIEILSEVACEGQCGVRFKGEFVVLKAH